MLKINYSCKLIFFCWQKERSVLAWEQVHTVLTLSTSSWSLLVTASQIKEKKILTMVHELLLLGHK